MAYVQKTHRATKSLPVQLMPASPHHVTVHRPSGYARKRLSRHHHRDIIEFAPRMLRRLQKARHVNRTPRRPSILYARRTSFRAADFHSFCGRRLSSSSMSSISDSNLTLSTETTVSLFLTLTTTQAPSAVMTTCPDLVALISSETNVVRLWTSYTNACDAAIKLQTCPSMAALHQVDASAIVPPTLHTLTRSARLEHATMVVTRAIEVLQHCPYVARMVMRTGGRSCVSLLYVVEQIAPTLRLGWTQDPFGMPTIAIETTDAFQQWVVHRNGMPHPPSPIAACVTPPMLPSTAGRPGPTTMMIADIEKLVLLWLNATQRADNAATANAFVQASLNEWTYIKQHEHSMDEAMVWRSALGTDVQHHAFGRRATVDCACSCRVCSALACNPVLDMSPVTMGKHDSVTMDSSWVQHRHRLTWYVLHYWAAIEEGHLDVKPMLEPLLLMQSVDYAEQGHLVRARVFNDIHPMKHATLTCTAEWSPAAIVHLTDCLHRALVLLDWCVPTFNVDQLAATATTLHRPCPLKQWIQYVQCATEAHRSSVPKMHRQLHTALCLIASFCCHIMWRWDLVQCAQRLLCLADIDHLMDECANSIILPVETREVELH